MFLHVHSGELREKCLEYNKKIPFTLSNNKNHPYVTDIKCFISSLITLPNEGGKDGEYL